MKIDGGLGVDSGFDGIMDKSREQEEIGYDGLWVPETSHDPFTMLPLMAEATENVELGTSIVVGFARNPMDLAYSANDIQLISKGRFTLGLGSQIKAHITRRFSMEWSKPAARMREMILATKAIWNSWNTGEKLDFRGDFYQHTLMTPFFHPGENPYGAPRMALAGVGPLMTEVAGETWLVGGGRGRDGVLRPVREQASASAAAIAAAASDCDARHGACQELGPTQRVLPAGRNGRARIF